MIYENIHSAKFISRPNRFIANIEINGAPAVCHVKNTGRCRELLTPNCHIFVERCDSTARKTAFDLISVYKGDRLINMDSSAPNKVFGEWAKSGSFIGELTLMRPETVFGESRLDFYFEAGARRVFAEVKGVTLEENGIALFPDAPTLRGLKHIFELIHCTQQGMEAYAVFIVQMRGVKYFTPNMQTQPEFANALKQAKKAGVHLLALDCDVTENTIKARHQVEIILP